MIPSSVHDFVKKVVEGTHPLNKGQPIVAHQANVLDIISELVTSKTAEGTGVITKREVKGVSTKDSGKDRTLIRFAVSDGENSVQCVAHNCNDKYLMGKLSPADLEKADTIIRKSLAEGKPIKIKGCYTNFKSDRVFAHRFQQDPKKDSSCIYNQPRAFWSPAAHHSVCRSFCDDVVHAG